jgi:prepilin-type N-terminal cleavage/methylation domain-containing protein
VCRAALSYQSRLSRTGLTLLEVMVALVILSLVATGFLQTFAGALRVTANTRIWAQALVYGEQGQEAVKVEGIGRALRRETSLGGGFARRIVVRPWGDGIARSTVTVTLPDGSRLELDRLVAVP